MAACSRNKDLQRAVKFKKNAYSTWQKAKSLATLTECNLRKKEAKRKIANVKNVAVDNLYQRIGGSQAEKHLYRLAESRHKTIIDVRGVAC